MGVEIIDLSQEGMAIKVSLLNRNKFFENDLISFRELNGQKMYFDLKGKVIYLSEVYSFKVRGKKYIRIGIKFDKKLHPKRFDSLLKLLGQ